MEKLEMNPYVVQIDKFVNSLQTLSQAFLQMESEEVTMTEEEYQEICEDVRERVCKECEHKRVCVAMSMLREVLCTIEKYGSELNVEVKRKMQKKCVRSSQFLRAVLDVYKHEKRNQMWKQKMVSNREGCAIQLDAFARMIQHSTRELNASIFEDEHLEKKIKSQFSRMGIRLLSTIFLVNESGRYEIHVTIKSMNQECVTTKKVANIVSACVGRQMVTGKEERTVIGTDYQTVVCVEEARFHTIQGVAKIGKGCEKISGDNFSMLELPGGKQCVILSDGMGAGQAAFKESSMVVEVLEELLRSGFPKETAFQMLNTAMVMGREEIKFSTIDMVEFDLETAKCELSKAGGSTTFIKRADGVECIKSTSLPVGVMSKHEIEYTQRQLQDGDMVIMMTDGVMDALPVGEQELIMKMIVEGTSLNNPKELAHHILEQVLECSGMVPADDMTVVAIGIWSLEK